MPKIDIASVQIRTGSAYPRAMRALVEGRARQALGNAGGLTQFGVNLTRLKPGFASSLRHWHEKEDELVFVLEGEVALVEDEGETALKAGDAATFKAGVANGHHLINTSKRDALILEIGTRSPHERAHYSDVDLMGEKTERGYRFTHKSGEPYGENE